MSGYTKNIAVIRGLKKGFSSDGGELSGLVKAERYGTNLKVEISLVNFAPLSGGRYVAAISDGNSICVMEGTSFEGESRVDTGGGFAALICFVNSGVFPVASAVCGNFRHALSGIREEIERQESYGRVVEVNDKQQPEYEDEALAQENYYEYRQSDKDGGLVCEDAQEEKDGQVVREDEKTSGAFKEDGAGGLAHDGYFYDSMKDEIEKVLSTHPREDALESMVENSRWVRINYGENYYVFGVMYDGGTPRYICYGVPTENGGSPPESLSGLASFIPAPDKGGYWVMFQDAATGASVKIEAE